MTPVLYQFYFSHYNERARWAFDYKGVPHQRVSLLPGPHMVTARRLTGQEQTPFVQFDDGFLCGSGDIVARLEQRHPSPPLWPSDPTAAAKVDDLCRYFADEVADPARCAFFFDLLPDGDYTARLVAGGVGPTARLFYRAGFPVTRAIMRARMSINAANAAKGLEVAQAALDRIAALTGEQGYLVGESFTAADLTAAAILHPCCFPPEGQEAIPEPRAPGLVRWLARFEGHPACRWIETMYRRHRGVSAAVA